MFLDKERFSIVIESTPLISIDLVVIDEDGNVLLGQRLNKPAKNFWFVPGGRIRKNEELNDAFARLTQEELGCCYSITQAKLLGPFTHLYPDHVFGDEFGTHYVAIAYILEVFKADIQAPLNRQHAQYKWVTKTDLLQDEFVHLHTKWYFE